jgi:hypothetical protein
VKKNDFKMRKKLLSKKFLLKAFDRGNSLYYHYPDIKNTTNAILLEFYFDVANYADQHREEADILFDSLERDLFLTKK